MPTAITGAVRRRFAAVPETLAASPDGRRWLALVDPDHSVQPYPTDGSGPPPCPWVDAGAI